MGILLLALLYSATAGLLALGVRWLLARESRPAPSRWALAFLVLLPLLYCAGGFLPGKVLAPTNSLVQVPPWRAPELVSRVRAGSTPHNPILFDPLTQMLPWSRAARDGVLFTPAQGSGAALMGNGQSAVLFPTEVASRLLPPVAAATYTQAARLSIAVFGLFLLLRSLTLSDLAGVAGSAIYLGSGFLQLWRLHPHSLVAAMLPWILWAALGLARRPGPAWAVALAVAGALGVYAGHPETLAHGVVLAAALALPVLLGRAGAERTGEPANGAGTLWREAGRRLGRGLLWSLVSGVLAFLLAAPALLPFLENLTVSHEWQRRGQWSGWSQEAPWERALIQGAFAATPWAWGDPRLTGLDDPTPGPDNAPELAGGAVGAAALMLVVAGLVRRRDPGTGPPAGVDSRVPEPAGRIPAPWLWLGLGLLGALVAAQTPVVSGALSRLPLLEKSVLGRLSLWWAVAASVLGALGLERLRRGERGSLLGAALGGLGVVLGLALVVKLLPASLLWRGVPLEAVALLVAGIAALLLARGGGRGGGSGSGGSEHDRRMWPGAILALAVLVLPRVLVFHGWVPVASALSFYPDSLAVRHVQELEAQLADRGFRVAGLEAALTPHAAAFLGLEEVRVYDPMAYAPYQRFLDLVGDPPPFGWIFLHDPAAPELAFLGVRWIFDRPQMGRRAGVEPVYAGPDAVVHENPRALPRVFVPQGVQIVPGPAGGVAFEAVGRISEELGDFRRRVVLQGRDLPPPGIYPNGKGRVERLRVEAGRLEAVVVAEGLALVATSQPAIPGWRLRRDGEEYRPVTVNGAFLGAVVEAGTSRLEWVYAPRSWDLGRALFLVGLLVGVGLGTSARRRRRADEGAGERLRVPIPEAR